VDIQYLSDDSQDSPFLEFTPENYSLDFLQGAIRPGVYPSLSPGVLTRLFCRGVQASLCLCRGSSVSTVELDTQQL